MVSAFALPALVASAASLPTGLGFGAGYGAGVRLGYDVLYPALAPFARQFTTGIINAVKTVWDPSGGADPVADVATSSVTSRRTGVAEARFGEQTVLSDVIGPVSNQPSTARSRQMDEVVSQFTSDELRWFADLKKYQNMASDTSSIPRGMTLSRVRTLWKQATDWIVANSSFQKYGDWLQGS